MKLKNEFKQFYVESDEATQRPTEIHIHTGIRDTIVPDDIVAEFQKAQIASGYLPPKEDSKYATTREKSDESFRFVDLKEFKSNNNKEEKKVKDEDLI